MTVRGVSGAGHRWCLAGCGTTDSWVQARARTAGPPSTATRPTAATPPSRAPTRLRLDWRPVGQGRPRRAGGARVGRATWPINAQIAARLLADGVGDRQRGPPTLVHQAVAGRRAVRTAVRRLRQPLRRAARRDAVVPADAVDPVAPAGDRHADDAKRFCRRANCWWSRTSGRCSCSTPTAGRRRHSLDLVDGVDPTDASGDSPIANRSGEPARWPQPRHSRRPPAWSWSALWEPNAAAPDVVGLRYRPGQTPLLTQEWTSTRWAGAARQPGARPPTARRSTSTAATNACGRWTPTTVSRNGRRR